MSTEVQYYAEKLSESERIDGGLAYDWIMQVSSGRAYGKVYALDLVVDGVEGCMMILSTPASTNAQVEAATYPVGHFAHNEVLPLKRDAYSMCAFVCFHSGLFTWDVSQ